VTGTTSGFGLKRVHPHASNSLISVNIGSYLRAPQPSRSRGAHALSPDGRRPSQAFFWGCSVMRASTPQELRRSSYGTTSPCSTYRAAVGAEDSQVSFARPYQSIVLLSRKTKQKPGRFRTFSIEESHDDKTFALGFERVPART
jgi:hypothetical protein